MTVAMGQRIYLSESLQSLIDSRLDTIDRMLLGRAARAERLAIVREVESQIHELLGERESEELSREDVLAVLARLDPPEAFLVESFESEGRMPVRGVSYQQPDRSTRRDIKGAARASGMLGMAALSLLLLVPVSYLLAILFESSDTPVILTAATASICMLVCGVVGIVTGVYARKSGVWALIGIATSVLALLFSVVIGCGLVLVS